MSPRTRDRARDAALTLAVAVGVAFGVRWFGVEPFRIPSESMLPTLWVGDHLFVNKFVYGARLPGLELRLPALRDPQRGEVVVFRVAVDGDRALPADRNGELPREDFVKRIIGVPGDRIEIQDDVVFVNGKPIPAVPRAEPFEDEYGRRLEVLRVELDGRSFDVLDDPRARSRPGSFVVEPGRYFLLGDNRDHSMDSRFWGTVRREEILGPAFVLYWSWDFAGDALELLNPATWWSATMRWDRIGSAVQ